ncbi:MAG: ROK family protein [Candidatus Latescibacterota bacterium]|nr:ROK family protein [Candidatus Latescibacterota bacterium]MEC8646972.1 ROK family protein [Candidatus Latescibacterota bacterium]MEE2725496.1 ROK family protein [Candidatus Latescibacterota bacterium]
MSQHYWGIDLGGTKIEGVVLSSTEEPTPLLRLRVPTEADRGYEHVIGQFRTLIDRMESEVGARPDRVGICTPGVIDPHTQRLKNCNATSLNGQPLASDLQSALQMQVITSNDANCFALAEARLGAARGAESVFGVILGSGVGGGIVVGNQALYGGQGIAGEWGHNPLAADGPDCYCGRTGCVETILAGPFLERHYAALSGQQRPLAEVAERAEDGQDPHATATIDRLVTYFGRAIAAVINIVDPHVVVLGGGVSNVDALYTRGVEEVEQFVFNHRLDTRIVRHELGDSAGVFGAAMLVA